MNTPLVKFDLCGDPVWMRDDNAYHHAIELGPDGNYWVATQIEPKTVPLGEDNFKDNGIAAVTSDGSLALHRPLAQILVDNDLGHLIYGQGPVSEDSLHINEIQPVFEDGELWRRGDLFLNLRNQSMVLLYRPETGEVLWHRAGPWLHQHDVNVLDDRRISLFDNNARTHNTREWRIDTISRGWIVDVPSDTLTPVAADLFEAEDLRTRTEGRMRILADGAVFIEETDYGRLIASDGEGGVAWSFINRAHTDAPVYQTNWARLIDRETGDAIAAASAQSTCQEETTAEVQ